MPSTPKKPSPKNIAALALWTLQQERERRAAEEEAHAKAEDDKRKLELAAIANQVLEIPLDQMPEHTSDCIQIGDLKFWIAGSMNDGRPQMVFTTKCGKCGNENAASRPFRDLYTMGEAIENSVCRECSEAFANFVK